jgi:hypothetical protein
MINKTNYNIDCFISAHIVGSGPWPGYDADRRDHLMYAMTHVSLPGDVLEFGVYRGKTITQIAGFLSDRRIWGFDSFEGLPEDWHMTKNTDNIKFPKGAFEVDRLPRVPDGVTLIKGWFNETIPVWKQDNPDSKISMLHVDCDLYSSTKEVLTQLNSHIVPGTVIVFDDMYLWKNPQGYELWHQGEYQALKEWLEQFDREFEVVSRNRYMQCAIRVTK